MVGKQQRKSRRRKLLEKDSEEKLLEEIAKIQAMLEEEDEAKNEENNEPQKNKRTRLGSPFPSSPSSSLSPESESCDENNEPGQSGHHYDRGNQPFYCLPVITTSPSTSRSYSDSFDKHFYQKEIKEQDTDLFKNLRRNSKEKKSAAKTSEDIWVPLTFLEPKQEKEIKISDLMSSSRPRIPDLSRRGKKGENPKEEIRERDKDYYKKKRSSSGSNSEISESEYLERPCREVKNENPSEEIRKKEKDYYESLRRSVEMSSGISKLCQEIKIENPSKEVRKRKNDDDKKRKTSAELNSESCSGISKLELVEPVCKEIKIENPDDNDSTNIGKTPAGLTFSACVSIAAKLPEETLLPLKFLQIPPLKVKVENQSELIKIEDISPENSRPVSRGEIEKVVQNRIKETESVSNKEKILKKVHDSLKKENLEKIVKKEPRYSENSIPFSVEKSENSKIKKKIDFAREIKNFSQKLRVLKDVEEIKKEF